MSIVFILVGTPILFLMMVWVVVTAWQILRPEEPIALEDDPGYVRKQRLLKGHVSRVRFQEIRELERERAPAGPDCDEYSLFDGVSYGVPVSWYADLDERKN